MKVQVGQVYYTKNLTRMVVVNVKSQKEIEVRFEGLIQKVPNKILRQHQVTEGFVKTPYCRSVFGVGYLGEGPFKVSYRDENGKVKLTEEYLKWSGILKRCYDETYLSNQPTYQEALVCNEWHNFQAFSSWCHTQKGFGIEGWQLDKDMHINACKIYSPDFCSFIPKDLNSCFLGKNNSRKGSKFVPGVFLYKNGYRATLSIFDKFTSLGYFSTEEKAYSVFAQAQKDYVKQLIGKYEQDVNENVILYMKSFKPISFEEQKRKMTMLHGSKDDNKGEV